MPSPSLLPCFYHPNMFWSALQITKLLIARISPASRCIIPLTPKHVPPFPKESVKDLHQVSHFVTRLIFCCEELFYTLAQPPSWKTASCRLTATACSIYWQLTDVYGGRILNAVQSSTLYDISWPRCVQHRNSHSWLTHCPKWKQNTVLKFLAPSFLMTSCPSAA
jgi:hypothetical protein